MRLSAGADVNQATTDDGSTPLLTASAEGHGDVAAALVWAGANVNQTKDDGATPLYAASQEGHMNVVAVLVSADCKRESGPDR